MKILHLHFKLIIILGLLLFPICSIADEPGGLNDDPGTEVPIDGGLSILLAAGVTFGLKKIRDRKNNLD